MTIPQTLPPLISTIIVLIPCFAGANSKQITPNKIGNGYRLISLQESSEGGIVGHLTVIQKTEIYGPDIPLLQLYVKHETDDRLRVHITDAENQRWEVPYDILPREKALSRNDTMDLSKYRKPIEDSHYKIGSELIFNYITDPFSFAIKRKSNGQTLFNSTSDSSDPYSNLVFKDQYLEISTKLPKEASLYGLGENTQPHGIKLYPNDPYTLYTTDKSAGNLNTDLYGSHPVYMDLRNVGGQGFAHAVLLLNSNGMDVVYRGDSVTFKVIGGVFDFYFFAGPTPLKVVDQYTALIGRPAPMPYWTFGFHQCKFGYQNLSVLEDVVENYKKAKIPLDVIWSDDDHMDGAKDFTLDPINYPKQKLLEFLDNLHSQGMKYIVIIDPGISINSTYGVYQRGMANDVFIKYEGKPFVAQVWPGAVYFPDYLNPKTIDWWSNEIKQFHKLVPIDGLWVDMNEASNFCTGLCTVPHDKQCPNKTGSDWVCCLDCTDVTKTKWDDPPYKINASGNKNPLGYKTIATSAVHYNGVLEYDAHSLYGLSESIATYKALLGIEGKRPFVLSRSTFVGSGRYVAHWTGDNSATWDDLKYSISTMLNFGIFGIPMVGSDICGFFSNGPNIEEELCNRWIELGAFYPFSRDHADYFSPRQELYQWETVAESARSALGMRYKLLPYLYTLSYEAHTSGAPIARPLFFSFLNLPELYNLSTQFLLGSSLMISPVLEQGKTEVEVLFPRGSWYDLFNMTQAITVASREFDYVTLDAPLNVINVHLYQNVILPMQQGGMLTKDARNTPFSLVVTFPAGTTTHGKSMGTLFLDDDELQEMKLGNGYSTYVEFYASVKKGEVKLWSNVDEGEFALNKGWTIEKVTVLGLEGTAREFIVDVKGYYGQNISNVEINSIEQSYVQVKNERGMKKGTMIEIKGLELPIGKEFIMSWKMVLLNG